MTGSLKNMWLNDNLIHLRLNELPCVASIVSLFNKDIADRIDNIYSYHKFALSELDNNPLIFNLDEINNYGKKFHTKKCVQPEFIFSEDYDVY